MTIGALHVGKALAAVTTTGSVQLALARDGVLLGFWLTAAATVTLYDAAVAATPGTAIMPATALAAGGWFPFPTALNNGLCVNISAGNLVAIVD